MLRIPTRTVLFFSSLLLIGAAAGTFADKVPARPARMASGETSPSGEKHPGEIVFNDKIENKTYSRRAASVVGSSAWVKVDNAWKAVVRIDITGTADKKTFTKYGADGKVLETQEVVPQPPRPMPIPPT